MVDFLKTGAPRSAKSSTSHDQAKQHLLFKTKKKKTPEGQRPTPERSRSRTHLPVFSHLRATQSEADNAPVDPAT